MSADSLQSWVFWKPWISITKEWLSRGTAYLHYGSEGADGAPAVARVASLLTLNKIVEGNNYSCLNL